MTKTRGQRKKIGIYSGSILWRRLTIKWWCEIQYYSRKKRKRTKSKRSWRSAKSTSDGISKKLRGWSESLCGRSALESILRQWRMHVHFWAMIWVSSPMKIMSRKERRRKNCRSVENGDDDSMSFQLKRCHKLALKGSRREETNRALNWTNRFGKGNIGKQWKYYNWHETGNAEDGFQSCNGGRENTFLLMGFDHARKGKVDAS